MKKVNDSGFFLKMVPMAGRLAGLRQKRSD